MLSALSQGATFYFCKGIQCLWKNKDTADKKVEHLPLIGNALC